MKITRLLTLLFCCFLILPSTVMAKGLFEHQSTEVEANQTVNDVFVVGADATIGGTVSSSVIVVNGDAYIKSTAHVQGFILVIGGKLQQEPGADIVDDVINISFDDATVNSLLIGGGMVLGIGAAQLAGSIILIAIPILMTLLGKRRSANFVDKYRTQSYRKLIFTGFFSGLLLLALCLLLLLTVVGIPLILLIALVVIAAIVCGLTVISHLIGEQFQGTADRADWVKATVGAFIVTSSVNIPFIGIMFLLVIVMYSLGITTTWVIQKIQRRRKPAG